MTTIRFNKTKNGYEVLMTGHANYNPGNDIVCSACSVLAYTLDNTLCEKGISHTTSINDGYMKITIDNRHDVLPYLEMTMIGFKSLVQNYPDNVSMINEI